MIRDEKIYANFVQHVCAEIRIELFEQYLNERRFWLSYGKQRFLPAWFDKISRIFSFFLLPFFFFIFSSTFENSRTGPLYGNVPRAQAKGKALLSCCSKQFLARKNLAAPHFPLPAIPSLSSPLLRFFLSLSLSNFPHPRCASPSFPPPS